MVRSLRPRVTLCVLVVLIATLAASIGNIAAASTPSSSLLFTGTVDDFYRAPNPLPPGAPGDLIRVQPVSSDATTTSVRIMYHSRDAQSRDRAVTGMLTYPNAAPPRGGWPVISWANGTVGMASQCAPSRAGRSVWTLGFNAVGVQSDYIGLGPVGERHPYLSRPSEGHSVIDAVRAARQLGATGAGRRWIAIGVSQGGHGAISANELGQAYAPELDLLGSVAAAPGAMFDRVYGASDAFVARVVGAMALYGAATEHPRIHPDDYVTPAAAAASAVIDTGCLNEIAAAFLAVPFNGFYTHDPMTTEPARSVATGNDVGWVPVDAPLLLLQGTADTTVLLQRTRDLFARLCRDGQSTHYLEYAGAGHGDVLLRATADVQAWISDRFAGAPSANSCPTQTQPTVTIGNGSVRERDHGISVLRIPVRLSAPVAHSVAVPWRTLTTANTDVPIATPGVDYIARRGLAWIPAGRVTGWINVAIRGDRVREPDESVAVALTPPPGIAAGGYFGIGAGTVFDND